MHAIFVNGIKVMAPIQQMSPPLLLAETVRKCLIKQVE